MLSNKKLEEKLSALQERVEMQGKELITLSTCVSELYEKLREKEEKISAQKATIDEQEKEIRRWNEGIANIMNYSLEVARGEKK